MFKLEVGNSYESKSGEIVIIAEYMKYTDGFSYRGDNGKWYKSNGAWLEGYPHQDDLVIELDSYENKHSHYKKDVSDINVVDIYDVLNLFEVQSHPVGHAIKKLLMAGKRGAKGYGQDIQEAIDSLDRELEMIKGEE